MNKFTLFADKLSIPTSAAFVNGGLICTNGPDMIFLKDTDGDDHADVRQVLFSGFKTNDTHAGVSNLRYGFDNWIYATDGYAGFSDTVGGQEIKFSTGLFRFKPDGSALEFLQNTTNNTWGLGFTSDFDILGSTANGNPSWYLTFAKDLYAKAGLPQPKTPPGDNNPKFFPASMDIRQVDQLDRYTAAAGHSFYTASRFPANYRDRIAFICEPTGKLVSQFEITAKGAGYVSKQLPNNLYSSGDGWSGPVCAETGPDGAVWIADWYNLIIQHNPTPNKNSAGYDAKTGKGNAYETPLRDDSFGRIFRVYPKGSKDDSNPKLIPTDLNSLLAGLAHPNLFWRLQAQRLIVESGSPSAAAKLKEIVKAPGQAAIHAFYALQGLNALDAETVKVALASSSRGLRRAAIANAPLDNTLPAAVIKNGLITATDTRELAEIFAGLSRLAPSENVGKALHATLVAGQTTILADATLSDAWQMAARRHAAGVILAAASQPAAGGNSSASTNLLPDPGFAGPSLGPWSLRPYQVERPGTVEVGKKRNKDADIVETFAHEPRYLATTNAKRLAVEMQKRHDDQHMSVVFSTYHSLDVISRAQQLHGLPPFDLVICDEAHRTTGASFEGDSESNFVKIHDNAFIRAAKRLYMTATPRIYGDIAKATAEKDNPCPLLHLDLGSRLLTKSGTSAYTGG